MTPPSGPAPASGRARPAAAVNAAFYAAAQLGGKVLTLVWTVVAARELSQQEFGSFAFALTVALLVGAIVEWGFDPVMIRTASREPAATGRLLAASFGWQTMLGIPGMLLAAALVWGTRDSSDDRLALAVVLAAALLDQLSDSCRAAAAARGDQRQASVALLVQRFVLAAVVLGALLTGHGLVGLAVAFLVGSAFGLLAQVVALARIGVRLSPRLVDADALRTVARGSAALGLSAVVLVVLARADILILEAMTGDAEVAVYNVAYRLFETTLFVTFAINSALFPRVSAAAGDHAAVRRALVSALSILWVVYLLFLVACLLEPEGIIGLLFGERYAEPSAPALRWLGAAALAFAVSYVVGSGLVAHGLGRAVFVSAIAATVVNLAMNFALIPRYGGTAAAAATAVAYAVDAGISVVWLRRVTGPLGLPRSTVEALAAAALMAGLLAVLPGPVLLQLALASVAAVAGWLLLVRSRRPELVDLLRTLVPGGRR